MTENIENNWYIKSRYLLLILITSFLISIILCFSIFSDYLTDSPKPLTENLFGYIWYITLFFFIYLLSKKASINWNRLFGEFKLEYITSKYILIVLPLVAISLFGTFLLFYPLSFWIPDFVKYWLIEDDINVIWLKGENYKLANILSFIDIVIIAPIIEEIFFRGLLFTSLAKKWNIQKAILLSSIVFGIAHTDIIGATIFGIVLSTIYIKSKSLFAPIIIHIANNALAFIISSLFILSGHNSQYTLSDFQNDWWIGLVGLIIGLPWFINFYKKEVANNIFSIPYFQNIRV